MAEEVGIFGDFLAVFVVSAVLRLPQWREAWEPWEESVEEGSTCRNEHPLLLRLPEARGTKFRRFPHANFLSPASGGLKKGSAHLVSLLAPRASK